MKDTRSAIGGARTVRIEMIFFSMDAKAITFLKILLLYTQTVIVSVSERSPEPLRCILNQNYPNPFNPSTTIFFELPVSGRMSLKVYDIDGRELVTLEDGLKSAGKYQTALHGNNLSSGVYFVLLKTDKISQPVKLILAK